VLVFVWLLLTTSCTGPATPVAETRLPPEARYVRIQVRADPIDPAAPFGHPVTLNVKNWTQILESVHVRPRQLFASSGTATAAFQDSERQYLAEQLADFFPKALSNEWVVFYLARSLEPGTKEVTSGAVFLEAGKIHLLFANYRHVVTVPRFERYIEDNPLRATGALLYEIVPHERQTVLTGNRWKLSKPLAASLTELVIDEGAEDRRPIDLEERLRALQRLYQQGLITEEEYRLKRQDLLGVL